MSTEISNYVEPANDVAKEFTKQYLLNDKGEFCFGKLVPVPDIIAKTIMASSFVVSSAEAFQAFKNKHQKSVHCEYEQEGLLYTLYGDGDVKYAVCTEECSERLIAKFGCNNRFDFYEKNWGTDGEAINYDNNGDDNVGYSFDTEGGVPFKFMAALTAACPEGLWYWSCTSENGFETLRIELHSGDVIITEHLLDDDYVYLGYDLTIEDLWWNDRGEVQDDDDNDTKLVPGEVFSVHPNYKVRIYPPYWPNWVDNCVKPANDAAKEFTKHHVVEHYDDDDDDERRFCLDLDKLVPMPGIFTPDDLYIVSPEELQAFKAEHQESVHCEYEQEGLLYNVDEYGYSYGVCTAECSAHLKDMYGCNNWVDFRVQNWGSSRGNELINIDHDKDGEPVYNFRTDSSVPWGLMEALTKKCPEGIWEWRCDAANGFESLVLQLRNGEVVITEHLLDEKKLESMRDYDGKPETIDDLHWNDRGEVLAHGVKNDTKLVLGKVFSVKPNYVVPKNLWGA